MQLSNLMEEHRRQCCRIGCGLVGNQDGMEHSDLKGHHFLQSWGCPLLMVMKTVKLSHLQIRECYLHIWGDFCGIQKYIYLKTFWTKRKRLVLGLKFSECHALSAALFNSPCVDWLWLHSGRAIPQKDISGQSLQCHAWDLRSMCS